MKSKCISVALFFFIFNLFSQTTSVPDDNFEAFLEANSMGDGIPNNDLVTTANINTVTSLFVDSNGISDLTGIEGFVALQSLGCSNNTLTSLNLTANTALTFLNCGNNSLSSLDLSSNTALTTVQCNDNQLTNLNVTSNTALFNLDCRVNQLASVDLSNNPSLGLLNIGYNPLSSLDVSQNPALFNLVSEANFLASLDVSNNTNLTFLNTSLMSSLTTINLASNTLLQTYISLSSGLTSLDVSLNTALTSIDVRGNQLLDLDLSQNTNLFGILCNNNLLQNLNVKNGNNSAVANGNFNASNNSLTCITVDDVSYSTSTWSNIDGGVTFSTNCALSSQDFDEAGFSLYPNPSRDKINITLRKDVKYSVVSLLGQELKTGVLFSGENSIDISSLDNGLYALNLESENGNIMAKKIIKK